MLSNTLQYIDPYPWITGRLIQLQKIKILDLSGTIWANYTSSFMLPQNWSSNGYFTCSKNYNAEDCFKLPTSWAQSSPSLIEINLSGLRYCLTVESCLNGYVPFQPDNYTTLVSVANFQEGGFTCGTDDNYTTISVYTLKKNVFNIRMISVNS
jgi:hypothetical protein